MQIPDEIRKCTSFACFKDKEGRINLGGTVFWVIVSPKEVDYHFGYLVTAKHVIENIKEKSVDGRVLIRINVKEGTPKFVAIDTSAWLYHLTDSSVDVAVFPIWLSQDEYDHIPITVGMAATEEVIKENEIGVGDEVFLTGLFVNHCGIKRNLPIVRVGNIALMPEEPVQTELGPIDAYLVEARSIGGLSGSPVFVNLGASRVFGNKTKFAGGKIYFWLGLMHGHFGVPKQHEDDVATGLLSKEVVNMGIAIVVPVTKILEVINQDSLVKAREKIIAEKLTK